MHSWALWPRKDYWNCYCDFAATTGKVYHTFTLLYTRLAGLLGVSIISIWMSDGWKSPEAGGREQLFEAVSFLHLR
jgi:hypothetical protein